MNKLARSLKEALLASGLQSGMTISFHHHLRNGDRVLNLVCDEIAALGLSDITINASSIHEGHAPLVGHMRSGVVTGLETNYIGPTVGAFISRGGLAKPVVFRTHGGRPSDIETGRSHIDVAFIAASSSDDQGNCTGKTGPSACGSLGYAFADAMYADKVVVVTDNLAPHPLADFSISEVYVDIVAVVDSIGDPAGIATSTTRLTRDPIALLIAQRAAEAIEHSGLLQNGFAFQTGAGGAALAAAENLRHIMGQKGVRGSYCMGGITGHTVDLLESGCFETLMDVQCFDLKAVESLRANPRHVEVSASHYASPTAKSALVNGLDVVVLGATQMDLDFNVNVHTDSRGYIMGGSGGHSDAAAGAKITIVAAPLIRARLPLIAEKVDCVSTPGKNVDLLVTQFGVAVNPARPELAARLAAAGLPMADVLGQKELAEEICGKPRPVPRPGRVVAKVYSREGALADTITEIKAD